MNLHPVVVHYPIALLTIYSLLELLRFKKLTQWQRWFFIKAFLLILGSLSTFAALQTGEIAETLFQPDDRVVRMHENFATASTWIYGILALSYLIRLLQYFYATHLAGYKTWPQLVRINQIVFSAPVLILLALGGLACLLITGALGGAMVLGPNSDPVGSFIYSWLIKK
ncbi:MAG TPA: DUF2231 domain-containing protein [Patescibacteria group bacterium]|nr:DUF2231 domain-containing protein [Patescibacteria group bacterium]